MKRTLTLAIMAILIACNTASDNNTQDFQLPEIEEKQESPGQPNEYADTTANYNGNQSQQQTATPSSRLLIKNATITLKTKHFSESEKQIRKVLKQQNAWLANEFYSDSDYEKALQFQIKVPAEKLEALMAALEMDGVEIEQKEVTTEDVTKTIIDNKGRIEAKKIIRQRYLDLLKDATNMTDVLQIQNEINRITEEMEVAAYTVAHLEEQTKYSTINLRLYEPIEGSTGKVWSRLGEAFSNGYQTSISIVIGLISIWPLLLIAAAVNALIRRRIAKKRMAYASKKAH